MRRIIMTPQGLETLKKREKELVLLRPSVVKDLARAREMGDLKENGYYRAAKMKLVDIDRELRTLGYNIRLSKVATATSTDVVSVGTRVMVSDGEKETEYLIVGELEANPKEQKLSPQSPIGKALMGRRTGEKVEVQIPKGCLALQITKITLL